jgi:hypothetical protein
MEPTQELIDALWYDKLKSARRMTEKQRLEASGELFDYACRITSSGIRHDHPDWTDKQVLNELRRRLVIGRQIQANMSKLGLA